MNSISRYQRHQKLIGETEFSKIQKCKIAVAGSGGLGSNVLQLLARIGFGEIHHWDYAIVDLPDLNRQILYDTNDLGKEKIEVAKEKLKIINPDIKIHSYNSKLSNKTIIPDIDLVIDCLDSFGDRLILENIFFNKGIPIIHAAVSKYYGQITSLIPNKTKSYSHIFSIDEYTEESDIKEVFPSIVTILASLQVSEAVKYISEEYDKMLINKLLFVDLFDNSFTEINLQH